MTTDRSDKVFESWRQATEKFDYFVLGVNGALCAYISQTYKPDKVGMNPGTIELVALLFLVLAAIAGFRRIERTTQITLLNHQLLRAQEEKGALVSRSGASHLVNESTGEILHPQMIAEHIAFLSKIGPDIRMRIDSAGGSAHRWYHIRNWLLLFGFGALLAAKVFSVYL